MADIDPSRNAAEMRTKTAARTFVRDRRGAILIMYVLLLPILVGAVGLGIEVALWYKEKRAIQTAADAAAIAGGYAAAESEVVTTAVAVAAIENGFDTVTNPPTVNNPPTSGAYTSDDDAVEVVLTESVNTLFSGLLSNAVSVSIAARAVATHGTAGEACVLSLNSTGTGIQVSGSGDITFDGCQVAANSMSSTALDVSGSGDLTVDCYSVVGGVSASPGLVTDGDCEGITGGVAVDDPYADIETPTYGTCDEPGGFNLNSGGSTHTFSHDPTFDVPYVICGDLWVQNGTLELEPGLYIVEGDIKTNASGNIVGDGVTLILAAGGQIDNFNGSSTIQLSAPDSSAGAGDWEGMLFYQDRNDATTCSGNNCNLLNGNLSSEFEGAVYFPNQEVTVNGGNSATSPCLQIVAWQVSFSGNSDMSADNTVCSAAGVEPIEIPGPIALVE